MKIIIISYSLTGNNEALAESIAAELAAEHIKISETRRRTYFTIGLDMLFNRTPKVGPIPEKIKEYDLVVFVGPVWMGQVATPFRGYFKHLKAKLDQYAFVSISGGADGPNPKLTEELKKRVGKEPLAVIDLHITELLPPHPKPTREITSAYHLNSEDVRSLTSRVMRVLREDIELM